MARSQEIALILTLTLLVPGAARAAGAGEPELVTDRPDQTESAGIVPVGALQAELGGISTWHGDGEDSAREAAAPGTLLRYGLTRRLELRLVWPGWIERSSRARPGASRSGAGDPELGLKLALADERGARPQSALLLHGSLPHGEGEFGSPRSDFAARFAAAHTLGERSGFGWNVGAESTSAEDAAGEVRTLVRWVYTAALGFDLAPRWGAFVELFGDLPASDPAPAAHSADAGVTYLVTPRLQLDVAAGIGLSDAAPDRFVGFGVSFRLPR
jgi:hypothetical protein